jgi:hypothetical protein
MKGSNVTVSRLWKAYTYVIHTYNCGPHNLMTLLRVIHTYIHTYMSDLIMNTKIYYKSEALDVHNQAYILLYSTYIHTYTTTQLQ